MVFYMPRFCKMCYVAFLPEEVCTDEPCCLVSPVGSGKSGVVGEVWNGCRKTLGNQIKSVSTLDCLLRARHCTSNRIVLNVKWTPGTISSAPRPIRGI